MPSAARRRHRTAPIPPLPPVTSTTRPSSMRGNLTEPRRDTRILAGTTSPPWPAAASVPPVIETHADAGRLHAAIAELATFNDDPAAGGITREVYTPTYRRALERVVAWMREAGLETRLDSAGN